MRTTTKFLAAAAAGALLVGLANTASAAIYVNDWTFGPGGEISVTFGDDGIGTADASGSAGDAGTNFNHHWDGSSFTDSFDFFLPTGTVINAVVSTSSLNFTGISFNGHVGNVNNSPGFHTGNVTAVSVVDGGMQHLIVTGTGPSTAVWSGTATFEPVPEPAVWAMMIVGLGGIGGVMRQRRRAMALA